SLKSISYQLAQTNLKYNACVGLLRTQYTFMNDIELRMAHVMKRDKPLKKDLERIRRERNEYKSASKQLRAEQSAWNERRKILEQENAWLVEQLHMARRLGKDMEALFATRLDAGKASDLEHRLHDIYMEKTRLELENTDLHTKIKKLQTEMERALTLAEGLKTQLFAERSNVQHLHQDNNVLKRNIQSILDARAADEEKNIAKLSALQNQIAKLDTLQQAQRALSSAKETVERSRGQDHAIVQPAPADLQSLSLVDLAPPGGRPERRKSLIPSPTPKSQSSPIARAMSSSALS
ncbi:hypothetical protein HDU91_004004, partial [Kappamyces sp. JEL0680]